MQADTAAVILAAGKGSRMGGGNKALLALGGEPLLAHSLRAFAGAPSVGEITVVMPPDVVEDLRARWGRGPEELGATRVVAGGAERWDSSRLGCRATDARYGLLAVHDAARPLITAEGVERVLAVARESGAALAAEAETDTLKRGDGQGRVLETVPRTGLWRAQTPQAFRRADLLDAFDAWPAAGGAPTDECMLVERGGVRPVLVPLEQNFKVTMPADLELAEAVLQQRGARA